MTRRWGGLVALFGLFCDCARLPEIASEECGNGVIEAPEDCDTFDSQSGASCRPKGSVGECHLDCTTRGDGSSVACPSGWGCDLTGLCRRPTGEFEPVREFEVGSAAALASGDFDGDGRADVASLEAPDGVGFTRLKFHYFDERAALADTRAFPRAVLSPFFGELSGDGRSDVVFTDFRLGVLLGRPDRSWVPETFSSYRIPETSLRTLSIFDGLIQQASGFIVFGALGGMPGLYVTDAANAGSPRLLGRLGGPIEMLVGDPVGGRVLLDEALSPCKQIVLALRGETRFSLIDACARDVATGDPLWLPEARELFIPLDPPEPIDAAPQLVDMNQDGRLDVLVGGAGRAYVSYGDGLTLAPATPYLLPRSSAEGNPDPNIPMPLVAGDVTGDAAVDFVFDSGMLLSAPSSEAGLFDYVIAHAPAPGLWSAALIADLNGNGKLDVVTASKDRPGISFFNGTGTFDLTFFGIATGRPVQHLTVGDFDGDFIDDLAFTQNAALQSAPNAVMIAFGAVAGPPLAPAPVARVDNIDQLNPYREDGLDHLIVASTELSAEQRRGVLTLLVGSGDRIPIALYELTNFAADSSTEGSAAFRALAGDFTAPGGGDVLALAVKGLLNNDSDPELWLLPALATSAGTPVRLGGGLDPALQLVSGDGADAMLSLATASADLDADGRDEALLAMPAGNEECGLLILGVEPREVVQRGVLIFDEPCARIELLPADVDGDGFVDVGVLTGRADGTSRQLSIFWNDGRGGFDSGRRALVTDAAVSAQAFAVLPGSSLSGVGVAYATAAGVELASLGENAREFGAARLLAPLEGITGMTAADLNGDGAVDLALAANGNLNVLKAILEAL